MDFATVRFEAPPARTSDGRVQLWRKLRKFGAIALKTSAYVLPDDATHYGQFQELATHIREGGGEATLIRVSAIEDMPYERIVHLFNDARSEDYSALITEASALLRRHRKTDSGAFLAAIERLQERFAELRKIDFFDCPKAADVQMLLDEAQQHLHKTSERRTRLYTSDFGGRTWVTRPCPECDRVASAWLIRRFIDADARFVFSRDHEEHVGALPFDMPGAEFGHSNGFCTFETFVQRFRLEDSAVLQMGEMVHDADLEDGKFKRYELMGLNLACKGMVKQKLSDAEIFAKSFEFLDAIHASLKR